ncbi:MAG: transglycosylase domain-containing protein [Desulfobacterium sp.]|nr:transglycosylase domain-containing protein [Desulfobacterium sp.]
MKQWSMVRRVLFVFLLVGILGSGGLVLKTRRDMIPMPASLAGLAREVAKPRLVDRFGNALTVTYTNPWNTSPLRLHHMPERLRQLFIFSEDRRFFDHHGVDWMARIHALWQNIRALGAVRGASTITEQVVRMIHPRKRTVWSRWLEGFEAMALERSDTKQAIQEFYLNQVPYAANRRGIAQAASFYFNRSLATLNLKEMMALVVLVRAPSYYDLRSHPGAIEPALGRFADVLLGENRITEAEVTRVKENDFALEDPSLDIDASHFARFVFSSVDRSRPLSDTEIDTTLDGPLQNQAQRIMAASLGDLRNKHVTNGACLVVDHRTGEILAWVSAGNNTSTSRINAVLVPRQPGSSLKPLLYALALSRGWTAATLIADTPLTNPVGRGLHTYHNYSRRYYGPVTLRQALGNSLNIPAVRAIRFTGVEAFLATLEQVGITSLDRHPDFYGDGLALGNGEITLYELVRAYNTLANRGVFSKLSWDGNAPFLAGKKRVFSPEVASIIANILSDPEARALEFGRGTLLNFPVQTAVKTGTSSDYRDAWSVGFNHAYTIGVWMGNLDGRPMDGVTGSTGPGMVLRSLFSRLNETGDTAPLFLSPRLVKIVGHGPQGKAGTRIEEWFVPGTKPDDEVPKEIKERIGFLKPMNGLEMAMDPRIPDPDEVFEFVILGATPFERVEWTLDGKIIGNTRGGRFLWQLRPGDHLLSAIIHKTDGSAIHDRVTFKVTGAGAAYSRTSNESTADE